MMEPAVVHVLAPLSAAAFLFVLARFAFCKWLPLVTSPRKDATTTTTTTAATGASARLPPGPPALPVLGNVHQLPSEYQEKTFGEWTKAYGDVVYAKIFRRPVLVLGSLRAAQDLLERKSGNFSDRPRLILLSELMGWDNVITHMRYGERFRKHRRWMHDNFQTKRALHGYRAIQQRETYTLLAGLLECPDAFLSHINRWATGMIMEITYGHRIQSMDDKYVKLAHEATEATVRAGSPGSMLVDFFPVLKNLPTWMPGAGFKRDAMHIRKLVRAMMDTPYEMVSGQVAAGTAPPSFTASLLEETYGRRGPSAQEAEDIKGAAGVIYGAGTETTVTVLSNFMLAMVLHPNACRRAQEEVDAIVGRARLPDFDDRPNMPYLDALLAEVLRWRCPVPLGIPHNTKEPDGYRGYHIPGNTMVIPNMWKMTQDTDFFPSPEAFRPERWLAMDAATAEACHPRRIVFGFGRRLCPGREFAEASIWLAAAGIVALFDVAAPKDGRVQDGGYISGFVSQPKPFACAMRPRAAPAKTQDLIAQARAALAI